MAEFIFTINQLDGFQNMQNENQEFVIAEILDSTNNKMLQVVCTNHIEDHSNVCLKINGNILESNKDFNNGVGFQRITNENDMFIAKWDIEYTIKFDIEKGHYYITIGSNGGSNPLQNSGSGKTSSDNFKYVFYNGDNKVGDENNINKYPNQTLKAIYYNSMGSWNFSNSNSSVDTSFTNVDDTTSSDINSSEIEVNLDTTTTIDNQINIDDIAFNITEQTANQDSEVTTQISVNNIQDKSKDDGNGSSIVMWILALLIGIILGLIGSQLLYSKQKSKVNKKYTSNNYSSQSIENDLKIIKDRLNKIEIPKNIFSDDIEKINHNFNDKISTINTEIDELKQKIDNIDLIVSSKLKDKPIEATQLKVDAKVNAVNKNNDYLKMNQIEKLLNVDGNKYLIYNRSDDCLKNREGNENEYYIAMPCKDGTYAMIPYYMSTINKNNIAGIDKYFDCKNVNTLSKNLKWKKCVLQYSGTTYKLIEKGEIIIEE